MIFVPYLSTGVPCNVAMVAFLHIILYFVLGLLIFLNHFAKFVRLGINFSQFCRKISRMIVDANVENNSY